MRAQIIFEVSMSLLLSMMVALYLTSILAYNVTHSNMEPLSRVYQSANLTVSEMGSLCGCAAAG